MCFALLIACATLSQDGSPLLEDLLRSAPERFGLFLEDPEAFRLQIELAEIVEEQGKATLRRHSYRSGAEYFYPASSIKTCAAVAALQVLRADEGPGVTIDTPLAFHPLFEDEQYEAEDPTNLAGGTITVGHEIRKLFLVSDNRAFNRLYELVGYREINEAMWAAGLASTRIHHRLSEFRSREEQLLTPRVDFLREGAVLRSREPRASQLELDTSDLPRLEEGRQHVAGGETVEGPFSFRFKNAISLRDLQDMHLMILRPDLELGKPGFALSEPERAFLARAMSEYAGDSANPTYDRADYPDDYVRFFLPGLTRVVPQEHLAVYDKVGLAYGFTVENAYVVDRRNGRAFALAATLYTNPNGVINDGDYAYEELALPFYADLAEAVARAVWDLPAPPTPK